MNLQVFLLLMVLIVAVTVLLPDHPMTDWEMGGTEPNAPETMHAADSAGQSDDQCDDGAARRMPQP